MKQDIRELIRSQRLFFDGGTGTILQQLGLAPGEAPEEWNLSKPQVITGLHREYIAAGCNIIKTNTFGVSKLKYENYKELIIAAINCAKEAAEGADNVYIAFDIGPTGKLIEPLGDLSFEAAVEAFGASAAVAAQNGAELILIETMNDSLETKAAVIGAKEACDLPIFVTNAYDISGKLMTGASPEAMIAMLEGLGVDALGMNCSFGPDKMLELLPKFLENASVPIIVNPNAGLPVIKNNTTTFETDSTEFSALMKKMAESGANILGGCCGTTPEYIRKSIEAVADIPYRVPTEKEKTVVSSYSHSVEIGASPILIGERINPTGKKLLKQALRENDLSYLQNEAIKQCEAGVQLLDINVGLPEIDETQMLVAAVKAVQTVSDAPLQLDSGSPQALGAAMRIYNGKPMVNSVNGSRESLDSVLPLVKKYGGVLVALTMDENGIPSTAQERAEIAEKIIAAAKEYGISKKDIIIDPLAMSVSSNANAALITLEAISLLQRKGIKTTLGVSNVSFGLPSREIINASFFGSALEKGLCCAIMNPFSKPMLDAYHSFRLLHGFDENCSGFIAYASSFTEEKAVDSACKVKELDALVYKGLKSDAVEAVKKLLESKAPLDIINEDIIPALNRIGDDFEQKRAYLPQLLISAETASAVFEVIKEKFPKSSQENCKPIILATVKGDIHDIGKNILKLLLESYGFLVFDLGRDVAPETVLQKVEQTGCRLVALSALMTTTVPSMEETIRVLHEYSSDVQVIAGGAVMNEEYAAMIKADHYAADAMAAVRIAESFYN